MIERGEGKGGGGWHELLTRLAQSHLRGVGDGGTECVKTDESVTKAIRV